MNCLVFLPSVAPFLAYPRVDGYALHLTYICEETCINCCFFTPILSKAEDQAPARMGKHLDKISTRVVVFSVKPREGKVHILVQ